MMSRLDRMEDKIDEILEKVAVHSTLVNKVSEQDKDIKDINKRLDHQSGWIKSLTWTCGIVTTVFAGWASLHGPK